MGIPAKTSFKTTAFGVRARELVIAGGAGFVGLAILALPVGSIFIRIVVMAGLSGAGILYAFWRVDRTWSIEEYLFNRWKYGIRSRRFVKGGSLFEGVSIGVGPYGSGLSSGLGGNVSTGVAGKPRREFPFSGWEKTLFWLPESWEPHSNTELTGMVLSVFALVVFLAWVGTTGGVSALEVQIQLLFAALFNH